MTSRIADLLFVIATIVLTVYGQVALKWRMNQVTELPTGAAPLFRRMIVLLFDPVVASTFAAAFAAGLAWMAALTRFDLSRIYPLTSLNFVLVLLVSVLFLGESLDWSKTIGIGLIVAGTIVVSGGLR